MSKKTLKCAICDGLIDIEHDSDYVFYVNRYYHSSCFVQKRTSSKRNPWTEQQCIDYIEAQRNEREQKAKLACVKDDFFCWIMEYYGITVIPTYFFKKIADVFSGKYKGLSAPIPVEDVFDMWKRKANYLTKVYLNNQSNGKSMTADQRLNYDLAILLNKYDSYLAWKEETKAAQIEAAERVKERVETKYSVPVQPMPKASGVNIYSILDEI